MKQIPKDTFYLLLIIYTLFVLLIALGLFWKYSLQFHILAFIIGLLGISILPPSIKDDKDKPNNKSNRVHYTLLALGLLLIVIIHAIPYFGNSIPLGYDTGFYKYTIESALKNGDKWIVSQITMEPLFTYSFTLLNWIFGSQFILTWLLIIICAVAGLAVYLLVSEFHDRKAGLLALFIYAFSIVQFKAFSYMYYRNILGIAFLLFALFFLIKYEKSGKARFVWLFVLLSGLLEAIHRPTFYIFGLSYFFYAFISPLQGYLKDRKSKKYDLNKLKWNIIYGILIIGIGLLFYIGNFWPAVYSAIPGVVNGFVAPGESPGTFISFFDYQFSSLFYIPLALVGLFYFIKKKDFNILVIWAILNIIIVYFQFFFFNRFIIPLDLILIIMASVGFSIVLAHKKKLGITIILVLLVSGGILAFKEAQNAKPLISNDELNTIKYLDNTEKNAFVMSTSSTYSPWVLAYSERRTIAPGLLDYDNHTKEEWQVFWTTNDSNQINTFLEGYGRPLYIFIGQKQKDNLVKFNSSACFTVFHENNGSRIYKYTC